jgi:hypothetical protein
MAYGTGYAGGYGASAFPDGLRVEIDWNKDSDYSDILENVTTRVRPGMQPISVSYGRDQSTALAPTVSGSGGFTLNNSDRVLSPRNTASPLYGNLKPARPVLITRTISATDYCLFNGHTDDNPINPDVDNKTVSIGMLDWLADFRGQTISTGLYAGVRTGEAIGYILDACGWSATLRDLDGGATVIPWFWADGKDAATILEEIVRSEGPPALLTIGANGSIVFRDRHHRLTRTASITSQGTWRGSGVLEPVMQRPFVYDEAWKNVVNTGSASVDVRTPQALQTVWTADTTIGLSAGESRLITVSASDPFFNAIPPVAGTDFTVSGTVTTALTRTSGGSTTIIITAVGAATVTALQLRAQPVTVAYTVQVSASDSTSITDYGPRSFPGDLPWCTPADAQSILSLAVAQRAQPLPIVLTRFMLGNNTTKAAAVLARDLSDRVTVIEPETVTNGDFYVETIAHQLTGTFDHEMVVGLEAAYTPPSPLFRFDTTGAGFDQGKWGNGQDDPASIFQFDTAGHGFDQGMWSS